jgi:thiol-disulfide isomerase/thioredoxin
VRHGSLFFEEDTVKMFGVAIVLVVMASAAAQCACSGGRSADQTPSTSAAAPGTTQTAVPAATAVATPAVAQESANTVAAAYPGLASGGLTHSQLVELPEGLLLRSGDVTITSEDLADEIAKAPKELQEQLRKNAFFLLEQMAARRLMLAEAKAAAVRDGKDAAKMSEQELLKGFFEKLTADVKISDAEVSEFYENNKEMVGGQPLEAVKEPIAAFLHQQKRQEAVGRYIETLGRRTTIEVSVAWVKEQSVLAQDNPVDKARASGKPSLVDFGSKGCIPCDKLAPILETLKTKYEGKANVIFVSVRDEQILAARYGIQSIPVQIFFDATGKETFRHTGFWPQEDLEKKLAEMGVN